MAQGVPTKIPNRPPTKKTICTPEIIDQVCARIRRGGYPTVSLEALGLDRSDHHYWVTRATEDYAAGLDERTSMYCAYSNGIKIAQADWQDNKLMQLESVHNRVAMDRPELWASVTTSLERRDPEHWGKRERQEPPQHNTQVLIQFAPFPQVSAPVIEGQVRELPAGPAMADGSESPPRICGDTDEG